MRLEGKAVVITGAASGMGLAMATRFAAEGASITAADWNAQRLQQAVRTIEGSGGRIVASQGNIADQATAEGLIDLAVKTYGRLDVLVNNAGYTHKNQSLMTVTEDDFDRVYAVNVKSIYLATLAAVPVMELRGGGVIINTASTAGVRPRPGLTWYNGSKGAAIILTKSMAAELAPKRIRVNAINPVIGETGMLEQFMGMPDTPENRAKFLGTIPLGRMSKPSDIANAALFLAEPASEFITGVCLEVDGGRCV